MIFLYADERERKRLIRKVRGRSWRFRKLAEHRRMSAQR